MAKQMNIFLTGITGFLGSFLAKELIQKGYRVFGLARPKGEKSAKQRVMEAVRFAYYDDEWNKLRVTHNLKVIEGDISYKDLGINAKDQKFLQSEIDIIIHSAALAELRVPWNVIKKINVDGTKNVLDFAMKCKKKGRLQKFNHISTIYVCGDYEGEFDESMLDLGQGFHNAYERSKFEAEVLVHKYIDKGLNCSIFRPSLIMGDSKTGKTNNFRLFYQPLRQFVSQIFEIYPADLKCSQNLINIDTVASAVSILADLSESATYHLISPKDTRIKDFIALSAKHFGFKMPRFIRDEEMAFRQMTGVQRRLSEPFLPYFRQKAKFVVKESLGIMKKQIHCPTITHQSFKKIFNYCLKSWLIVK